MTLVDRIKLKCKEKSTSMNALEGELGLGNGTIRRWDERVPGADRLLSLANRLDVSVDWLLTGKEQNELTDAENHLIELYRQADDTGKRIIMTNAEMVNPSPEQQSTTSKIS